MFFEDKIIAKGPRTWAKNDPGPDDYVFAMPGEVSGLYVLGYQRHIKSTPKSDEHNDFDTWDLLGINLTEAQVLDVITKLQALIAPCPRCNEKHPPFRMTSKTYATETIPEVIEHADFCPDMNCPKCHGRCVAETKINVSEQGDGHIGERLLNLPCTCLKLWVTS